MSWRTVVALLLLIGALAAGWAVWNQRRPPPRQITVDTRPDYVLHNFEITSLDAQGKESFTLRAPYLERHPGEETMDLTTPLFLVPNAAGQYWEVRSQHGWVSADQQEIRLNGDVNANSPAGASQAVSMKTGRLTVFPQKNRAVTDDVMTIVQPGSILRGRGFEVSTATKRYVFRSEVQSTHAPIRR